MTDQIFETPLDIPPETPPEPAPEQPAEPVAAAVEVDPLDPPCRHGIPWRTCSDCIG
jgi:hypothetical protein